MQEQIQTDGGRSPVGTLVLLALSFVAGYVLGSRGDGASAEWQETQSEPTEITIDGDEDETEE